MLGFRSKYPRVDPRPGHGHDTSEIAIFEELGPKFEFQLKKNINISSKASQQLHCTYLRHYRVHLVNNRVVNSLKLVYPGSERICVICNVVTTHWKYKRSFRQWKFMVCASYENSDIPMHLHILIRSRQS